MWKLHVAVVSCMIVAMVGPVASAQTLALRGTGTNNGPCTGYEVAVTKTGSKPDFLADVGNDGLAVNPLPPAIEFAYLDWVSSDNKGTPDAGDDVHTYKLTGTSYNYSCALSAVPCAQEVFFPLMSEWAAGIQQQLLSGNLPEIPPLPEC